MYSFWLTILLVLCLFLGLSLIWVFVRLRFTIPSETKPGSAQLRAEQKDQAEHLSDAKEKETAGASRISSPALMAVAPMSYAQPIPSLAAIPSDQDLMEADITMVIENPGPGGREVDPRQFEVKSPKEMQELEIIVSKRPLS